MNTETLRNYAKITVRTKVSVSVRSVGFMIGTEVVVSENGRRVI